MISACFVLPSAFVLAVDCPCQSPLSNVLVPYLCLSGAAIYPVLPVQRTAGGKPTSSDIPPSAPSNYLQIRVATVVHYYPLPTGSVEKQALLVVIPKVREDSHLLTKSAAVI